MRKGATRKEKGIPSPAQLFSPEDGLYHIICPPSQSNLLKNLVPFKSLAQMNLLKILPTPIIAFTKTPLISTYMN